MTLLLINEATWKPIDDWLNKQFTTHNRIVGRESWCALPRLEMSIGGKALELGLKKYREWIDRHLSKEDQSKLLAQIMVEEWKLPRAPLFRFCTIRERNPEWPDQGDGVWEIYAYDNLDMANESYVLRRVMPGRPRGSTGETINISRHAHDKGNLRVWAENIEDPRLCLSL